MTKLLSLSLVFVPGLALTLLQACGSGAEFDSNDLQRADEDLEGHETNDEAPDCAVPAICQLCDDGSCATPHVQIVDGECGPITYTCEGATDDADGNATGAPTSSPPAPGQIDGTPPSAAGCQVPAICQLCDDGSCAAAHVELVDGECGPITYNCDGAPPGNTASPVAPPPDAMDCPAPAICQLCDDGSCATPEVEYKDGKCGAVHFVCAGSVEGSSGPDGVDPSAE